MSTSFIKILSLITSIFKLIQKILADGKIGADDLIAVAEFIHDEFGVPVELDLNEFAELQEKTFSKQ